MSPTLRDGDTVLVRYGVRVRVGDVVLARYRSMPDRDVIKRVVRHQDDGWWLSSDNAGAGGDSDTHGIADVSARAVLRWRTRGHLPQRIVRRR